MIRWYILHVIYYFGKLRFIKFCAADTSVGCNFHQMCVRKSDDQLFLSRFCCRLSSPLEQRFLSSGTRPKGGRRLRDLITDFFISNLREFWYFTVLWEFGNVYLFLFSDIVKDSAWIVSTRQKCGSNEMALWSTSPKLQNLRETFSVESMRTFNVQSWIYIDRATFTFSFWTWSTSLQQRLYAKTAVGLVSRSE